ncbi:zona pellucida sperm-binding protein 4 [Dipodomys spectabilis]|uniref:zona pellucida sperm-binding protein 4 n=1 Tax=Dipodomys spectabilis TaxID=105255 RepID=UPI001C547A8D|nr:zona pellucida sperm-binding protein 4 [Dipodomys spectabilis]
MQLLWFFLLCLALSLPMSGQHVPESVDDSVRLHCGPRSFRLTINHSHTSESQMLTAWDKYGMVYRLQNDSDCGIWVTEGPGGSVVLEAAYSGCLVIPWGSSYTLLVEVKEAALDGSTLARERKVFRCPRSMGVSVQQALEAHVCKSVTASHRLPCGPSPISRESCEELGCCYSSREEGGSCYYGNQVTTHCSQEGGLSIALSRNVVSPPLRLDSVHLILRNESGCGPVVTTPNFVLFRFPFTSCGTIRRVVGDQAVYENELAATREVRAWGHASITRDSDFRLRVSCSYSVNSDKLPVHIRVFTVSPPPPKTRPGPLTMELRIAKDKSYVSYYSTRDYPVVKSLRDPIYVEVSILHRTDPQLGLILQQCWATPSPNPRHRRQWPILVKGCPYAGDNYQTQQIPVQGATRFPSHHRRFSISTFSFMNSTQAGKALGGQVYLHCSTTVCQPAGAPSCVVTCPVSSRRGKSGLYFENSTASISSNGPMILLQSAVDPPEELNKYPSTPADSPALWVAGISGSLIIMGALCVSSLALRKQISNCNQMC